MSDTLMFAIGFLAQGFFSARILVQWIMSERSHQVVSPSVYWVCSLVGSVLLFTYGWMRDDFSIILGQILSYYIYIWNLNAKGLWGRLHLVLRGLIILLPLVAFIRMASDLPLFVNTFLRNDKVPLPLLVWGSLGQVIFTVRFVYQWYYSYRRHQSILPLGFWLISLIGSGIIISYGIFRLDPVIIIGQSFGFVAYIRNMILYKQSKQ